jgi:H/ACA ribonucleoprotein complex subunit 3
MTKSRGKSAIRADMMFKMRFCHGCQSYTLEELHCGNPTVSAHPAGFNPNDKYGDYRRRIKFGS